MNTLKTLAWNATIVAKTLALGIALTVALLSIGTPVWIAAVAGTAVYVNGLLNSVGDDE
jgi:hypothetical protein